MNRRTIALAFAVVAAVQLVPLWSVRYLPTSDGPEHVYNAVVIHDLAAGRRGPIADVFAIDWRPHPNWIGSALMAALICVVSPLVAEKLFLSLILLLFAGSVWMLASRMSASAFAFLAFPFVWHVLLQLGFYNFSAATGLAIATIAMWWARRDAPTLATIAIIGAMLVLTYFSHPLPLCIAMMAVGVLWLGTLRGRPFAVHVRHLAAFVPVAPLMIWYALQQRAGTGGREKTIVRLLKDLAQGRILLTFDHRQLVLGTFAFVTIAALVVATALIERRTARDQNLMVAIVAMLFALYLWSPRSVAGGLGFSDRVVLFVYLLPIAWLSPRIPSRVQNAIVAIFGAIGIANAIYVTTRFREYAQPMRTIVERARHAEPQSRILPLIFERNTGSGVIPFLWHSVAYGAAENRLVDLDNYEPRTGYFPTRYRGAEPIPDFSIVEYSPDAVDVAAAAPYARYIVTWKLPPNAWTAGNLERLYRLVDASGGARLYERRSAFGVERIGELERVLLPIAGTAHEVTAMYGARWRVDQSVTNSGHTAVHVALSHCTEMPACDFDVGPGQTIPIFASDAIRQFVYAYLPRGSKQSIAFSSVARRTDRSFPEADVRVPAVPDTQFGEKRITIPGVIFDPDTRLNLRLYTLGITPPSATVRAGSSSISLPVFPTNYYTDYIEKRFPNVRGPADVTVETNARVWAFVTATDPQGRSTVYLPK